MNKLMKKIPKNIRAKIADKMAIEAGVATGPAIMVFKGEKFTPPVNLEAGLNWIEKTIKNFKGAHLKLDDFTVLWFSYNEFSRYDEKKRKRPIRPTITASGHKIEPFEPAGAVRANGTMPLKKSSTKYKLPPLSLLEKGYHDRPPDGDGKKRLVPFIGTILESSEWKNSSAEIPVPLGIDTSGKPIVVDLAALPHLLIAGSCGTGKAVFTDCLIISMLSKFAPGELRLMLFDPKNLELSYYSSLPHLILPVINSPDELPVALNWICDEIDRRNKILKKTKSRNFLAFNSRDKGAATVLDEDGKRIEDKLPRIIIILDELADIMITDMKKSVEESIAKIAQKGCRVGIRMIVSTQTPRASVITPAINSNLPARIAFNVSYIADSKLILGREGAENLLGRGDMLFRASSKSNPVRIQGAWVSEGNVNKVVKFIS